MNRVKLNILFKYNTKKNTGDTEYTNYQVKTRESGHKYFIKVKLL